MSSALLTRVDELIRPDHYHLTEEDECYFLREYIPGVGWEGGATNSLVANLKKRMDRKDKPEWRYKKRAMVQVAEELTSAFGEYEMSSVVLVPIPPSEAESDPNFDPRMFLIAEEVAKRCKAGYRPLLCTPVSRPKLHSNSKSRDVEELVRQIALNHDAEQPAPASVVLLDDVLTTGCTFVACKRVLKERFGDIPIVGVFVARRAIHPVLAPA